MRWPASSSLSSSIQVGVACPTYCFVEVVICHQVYLVFSVVTYVCCVLFGDKDIISDITQMNEGIFISNGKSLFYFLYLGTKWIAFHHKITVNC